MLLENPEKNGKVDIKVKELMKSTVETLNGVIHSGLRSKDFTQYILMDGKNFYKFDVRTKEFQVFEGKVIGLTARLKLFWILSL